MMPLSFYFKSVQPISSLHGWQYSHANVSRPVWCKQQLGGVPRPSLFVCNGTRPIPPFMLTRMPPDFFNYKKNTYQYGYLGTAGKRRLVGVLLLTTPSLILPAARAFLAASHGTVRAPAAVWTFFFFFLLCTQWRGRRRLEMRKLKVVE